MAVKQSIIEGDVVFTGRVSAMGGIESQETSQLVTQVSESIVVAQQAQARVTKVIAEAASDGKLTPSEKKEIKITWEGIKAEKPLILTQSTNRGISTGDAKYTAYVAAYNALLAALETAEGAVLADMTTTSTITGATFVALWSVYYTTRTELMGLIDGQSPTYTEIQQGYTSGGGTVTPTTPTLSGSCMFTTAYLQWDRQSNLTGAITHKIYRSLTSDSGYTCIATVSAYNYTDQDLELAGTEEEPTAKTYYYRVARVVNGTTESTASNIVALTANPIPAGSIEAGSITAGKIAAGTLNALVASISSWLTIGEKGWMAGGSNPSIGDLRAYLDQDEIVLQQCTNDDPETWVDLTRIDSFTGLSVESSSNRINITSKKITLKRPGKPDGLIAQGALGTIATGVSRMMPSYTWTERTISATSRDWRSIAWSPELGLFVMTAYGSTVCATSPDGITWTERTISATSRNWWGIAWSPELGLFVITAYGSTVCATSPDGITWTERTISATSQNWRGIVWVKELNLFIATASSSTSFATSSDGVTWDERTTTIALGNQLAWAPQLSLLVATGNNSSTLATSPDGITWTSRTVGTTTRSWRGIAWAPTLGLFVNVAYGSTICSTSPDGITWTERTISSTSRNWSGATWSPELGYFVITAIGSTIIATSLDGITWTERTISSTSRDWREVEWIYELGLFIAMASSSTVCATCQSVACELGAGIIESGSNANGYYAKYSDGTMMQWGRSAQITLNLALSNWYGSTSGTSYYNAVTITYPVQFYGPTIGDIYCYASVDGGGSGVLRLVSTAPQKTLAQMFVQAFAANSAATSNIDWFAIGRWKA